MRDALEASQTRYQEMIEQVSDGVAVVQTDRIVFVNDALCAIFTEPAERLHQQSPGLLLNVTKLSMLVL
jgi:PAS domain-containing protein